MSKSQFCLHLVSGMLLLSACEDEKKLPNQNADVGGSLDVGLPESCGKLSFDNVVLDVFEDTQTIYSAKITAPDLGNAVNDFLVFNFVNINERFGPMAIGTFPLDGAINGNRGTCAECVSVFVDQVTPNATPEKVLFQRSGTITISSDPRTGVFRAQITNLVLEEVTIDGATLESTPVAGGLCLEADDFSVDYAYVPPSWTCAPETYQAGDGCNCDCGAPDPDCYCDPFANPGCEPVIEDDCANGSICTDGQCLQQCDPFSSPVMGCDAAGDLCQFAYSGPVCDTNVDRVDPARLGENCVEWQLGDFIPYCALTGNVPAGRCADSDRVCRPLCIENVTDCGEDFRCFTFATAPDEAYGYCDPIPTIPPENWTCDAGDFRDKQTCHCGCGAADPDCDEDGLPIEGCEPGEMCTFGTCE